MKTPVLSCAIILTLSLGALSALYADSATWNLNPTSGNWNTAANWTPQTIPNGPDDIATFGGSSQTAVSLSLPVGVDSVVFSPGASAFTIYSSPLIDLAISGAGIVNNSGITQNFVANPTIDQSVAGGITFSNSATAGSNVVITIVGPNDSDEGDGGRARFLDSASADHAVFDVLGAPGPYPALLGFYNSSTAGNATITVHQYGYLVADSSSTPPATLGNAVVTNSGGIIDIFDGATAGGATIINTADSDNEYSTLEIGSGPGGPVASAGDATIINQGATATTSGSETFFVQVATAGNAVITCNGTDGPSGRRKLGGAVQFGFVNSTDVGTADHATLIANGGTNGGNGGRIIFTQNAVGGVARCELFGNGTLDISLHLGTGVTIGSLEGDGIVNLGAKSLTIGTANLSTSFAGLIQGTGAVTKIDRGSLTLSGANSFTGGTTLNQGAFVVTNASGSATGAGPVQTNAGTLAGTGIIAGATIIGTGGGTGRFLLRRLE